MSRFLQSVESLAAELEQHELARAMTAPMMCLPAEGTLAQMLDSIFSPNRALTEGQWVAAAWTLLTACAKRLVQILAILEAEIKATPRARHIVHGLLKDFEEISSAIERPPNLRGAAVIELEARAHRTATALDGLIFVLEDTQVLNGERADLHPPWGDTWEFFVGHCSGRADVQNRLTKLCGALDCLGEWVIRSGRAKALPPLSADAPLESNLVAPPIDDDEPELTSEQLAEMEADVAALPSDEVAEGEAQVAAAVARAPLIGGDLSDNITDAVAQLVDNGMPEELPADEPPPRVFRRRARKS